MKATTTAARRRTDQVRRGSTFETMNALGADQALAATTRRLAGFADLEPDWDSYGGKVPTQLAIEAAQELVSLVFAHRAERGERGALPSWVSPLPSGGIQLDWNVAAAELEVDVNPDGQIGYLLQRGDGNAATFDEADDVSPDAVLDLLAGVLR